MQKKRYPAFMSGHAAYKLSFFVGSVAAALGFKKAYETDVTLMGQPKPPKKLRQNRSATVDDYIYVGKRDDIDELVVETTEGMRRTFHYHHLRLSRSANPAVKEIAIKALGKAKKLNDGQFLEIAQSMDFDTSVKLARTRDVDLRMFLPPVSQFLRSLPAISDNLSGGTIEERPLHQLLKVMSNDKASDCTKFFAQTALESLRALEEATETADDTQRSLMIRKLRNNLKQYKANEKLSDWLAIQSILGYVSFSEETCRKLLDNSLLSILHSVREKYEDDIKFTSVIAQIIATVTHYREFPQSYFLSLGWIGVLASWLRHEKIELSLPAAKALYNLDNDSKNVTYGSSVYVLHPINRGQSYDFDIIFVHGLLGSVFKTWRQCDAVKVIDDNYTLCWPQSWLAKDMVGVRVLAVDYHTYLSSWNIECPIEKTTLREKAANIEAELLKAGVGNKPIIFLGHSMGGLLIKQLIVNCAESPNEASRKIAEQARGIIFYSVPHRGANFVWPIRFKRLALPSNEVMELAKNSPQLEKLNEKFLAWVETANYTAKTRFLSFGETLKSTFAVKGWTVLLVPANSADLGIGDFEELPANHLNICKPRSRNAPDYVKVREFISDIITKYRPEGSRVKRNVSIFESDPCFLSMLGLY